MNDERLTGLLGSLRHERMDRIADDRIRARLETAWTARAGGRSWSWRLRRIAPVLATVFLLAGTAGATMNASGDSVLYGVRVAVEDAAVALHTNTEDRNEYLLALLDARQAEAARLEASGNALAASKVRQFESDTLRRLQASLPQPPDEVPVVAPTPAFTPTPAPSATPAPPSPTTDATPVRTAPPRTPSPTAVRTPTPTPTTPKPTITPTGTAMIVTISGTIKNPDGTLASGVCVIVSGTAGSCVNDPTQQTNGAYRITVSGRVNQSYTLYFTRTDAGVLYKATVTKTITGTTLQMPTATLQK